MTWRFTLSLEFGRDEPQEAPHDTVTDALVERTDPEQPPIGFWPSSDPTRRTEDKP